MTSNNTTTSVPAFLGWFLFPPLLILLSVLLLWIYFESKESISSQQDLNIELNNRNTARELENIQQYLMGILDDTSYELSKVAGDTVSLDAEVIAALEQGNTYQFDLLRFVPSSTDQEMVINDSPFFDISQSQGITKIETDALLDVWHLIDVGEAGNPLWAMVAGRRVVQGETGLVLGVVIGGVVLNDNQSLTRAIQHRSLNALFVALEIEDRIVAANYPLSQQIRNVLQRREKAVERSELNTETEADQAVIISRLAYPFAQGRDLNIVLVYADPLYTELRGTFLRSGLAALFCTVMLFVIFEFLARRKLETALERLISYTKVAAAAPREAVYTPGTFVEFNRIGKSVEKTLAILNRTTEELQDSKDRLELTIEGASLGTWDWDISTGAVNYNMRWAEMLGYTLDEVTSQITDWENLLHPDEKESVLKKLIAHLDGKTEVYQSIHRLRSKSGQWIWVLDAGRVYKRDTSGDPLRAVGIHLDVTRKKEAEQALVKERALLLSLINSIPDLIFYKNGEGVYLGCNKAFEEFTGKSERDIINKTDLDLFPLDIADSFRKQDRLTLISGKSRRNDEWATYPDGRKVLLDTLKIPFTDQNNEILGIVGVSRDVTHKKKMEDELLKIEKLESVGVLAGGIAHDFNNILTAVLGNIELASYGLKGRESAACELLDEATKATRRAVKLTRQLLTFAKGDELVRDATDLAALIRETAEFVLHGSNVVCEYNFPEKLWMANADGGQISQVIQNIVINAKHAMEDGGTIRIHCQNVNELKETSQDSPHTGGFVKIVIADTGSGIPEEILDKIFDPYFTTKQKGSGLGLALSHSIIIKHQGIMTVQSRVGEGTTFTIFLPATAESCETRAENFQGEHVPMQAVKILLMDDDEVIRDVVGIQLKTLGHKAEMAVNGDEAVQKYKEALKSQRRFDIVIVDLTVPAGMGGEEAARHILEIDKDAVIVVVSGYSNDQVIDNFREYGFKGTLTKPFGLFELERMIKDVLG